MGKEYSKEQLEIIESIDKIYKNGVEEMKNEMVHYLGYSAYECMKNLYNITDEYFKQEHIKNKQSK